jgi:hypothetical protein
MVFAWEERGEPGKMKPWSRGQGVWHRCAVPPAARSWHRTSS